MMFVEIKKQIQNNNHDIRKDKGDLSSTRSKQVTLTFKSIFVVLILSKEF